MTLPESFEIYGRTIRVELVDVLTDDDGQALDGQWDPMRDLIRIANHGTEETRTATFLHEFVHAALEACGEHDLSEEERFVDAFSGLLHQMAKTVR